LRVGGQGRGVEHDLVADYRHRALQAFGDLLRAGGGEQLELFELLFQGREVEIAQVQGLVIEKHGATRAGHEVLRGWAGYWCCGHSRACPLPQDPTNLRGVQYLWERACPRKGLWLQHKS